MARYRNFDGTLGAGTDVQARNPALDDVRLRRAGLKAALSGLELALAAPFANRVDWVTHVREALDVVHEVWTRHIVETEAPGAFLDDLVTESPRLVDAGVASAPRAQRHPRRRSSRARNGSRRRPPKTTATSRGPRNCASTSPRSSPRSPATASAAPTSCTRPTRSTSAAGSSPRRTAYRGLSLTTVASSSSS